jgi:acyl-CoA-dependent ceramide synthase
MNGPLYKQGNSNVVLVRRPKRKEEGPMKQLARWFVDNQIGAPKPLVAAAAPELTRSRLVV